jgi:DNA replication protein DnaC
LTRAPDLPEERDDSLAAVSQLRVTIRWAFNLAFRDWHTIFPNAACAVGLIDRLTHHSTIVKITGESYRLREAERAQKARRSPAK